MAHHFNQIMKQMPLIQHKILPMRTAREQLGLAGVETQLVVTDTERGIVYITGAGAAIMTEAEWQGYLQLCDRWVNAECDSEGGDAVLPPRSCFEEGFREIEQLLLAHAGCIREDEREEMVRAVAGKVLALKEEVLRFEGSGQEPSYAKAAEARCAAAPHPLRWPLGIRPEMDDMAAEQGLSHWSCVSPDSNELWLRMDGRQCRPFDQGSNVSWADVLRQVDESHPQPWGGVREFFSRGGEEA